MKIFRFAMLAVVTFGFIASARGDNIDYSHITIVDSSPGFNADFDVSNIVRNNANLPDTNGFGYASQSQGADTFVDFAFDGLYRFDNVTVIDRIHSGAAADAIGGTADFVTEYDLILSVNPVFGDADDTVVSVGPLSVPPSPTGIDDFTSNATIGGVEAMYLRYDVVATNGANPGAHTLFFEGTLVPEPTTGAMLATGLFTLLGLARRKR